MFWKLYLWLCWGKLQGISQNDLLKAPTIDPKCFRERCSILENRSEISGGKVVRKKKNNKSAHRYGKTNNTPFHSESNKKKKTKQKWFWPRACAPRSNSHVVVVAVAVVLCIGGGTRRDGTNITRHTLTARPVRRKRARKSGRYIKPCAPAWWGQGERESEKPATSQSLYSSPPSLPRPYIQRPRFSLAFVLSPSHSPSPSLILTHCVQPYGIRSVKYSGPAGRLGYTPSRPPNAASSLRHPTVTPFAPRRQKSPPPYRGPRENGSGRLARVP